MYSRSDFKVVLLGGYSVGKTCLLYRLLRSKFCENIENTIAGVFTTKELEHNGQVFRLGIWDTCGQERFRCLVKMYYRDAHAAVICYDITDRESWTSLKHYVQELRDENPECRVYICGTKKDIVDFNPNLRQVDLSTVSFFTKGILAEWFETSSKSGENVNELFERIVSDFGNCFKQSTVRKSTLDLSQKCKKSFCSC